jgi:hypothetical protein
MALGIRDLLPLIDRTGHRECTGPSTSVVCEGTAGGAGGGASQQGHAIYASIAAFKTKAVNWFKTRAARPAQQDPLRTGMAAMRSGFVQIFSADESLMNALYALGVNADSDTATNEILAAGLTPTTAEDQFEKGMRQLRALR